MTDEEYENLEIGDKVTASYPMDSRHSVVLNMIKRVISVQEKKGYFTVKGVGRAKEYFGNFPYIYVEELNFPLDQSRTELYKPGWSYERDY
jgi:hypothetical protein